MADQLALPLDATADRLPDLPDLRPMLARPLPEPFDSDAAPVRAVVGRRPGAGLRRARRRGRRRRGAGRRRGRDRPDRGTPRAGRHGRAGRRAIGAARWRARRGRRRRSGRRRGARRAARAAARAARPPSWPSTSCTSMASRCSTSRWSSVARPCAGSCGRATRSSRCPAIATEGRALFEAIVAQGLAGMMARQRQGPYLPGRSQPAVAADPGCGRDDHGGRAGRCARGTRRDLGHGAGPRDAQSPARSTTRADHAAAGPRAQRCRRARRRDEPRGTRAAGRTAARRPRRSGPSASATTAIVTSRMPTDRATSHGWTLPTISRASIANGLNGGHERREPPDEAAAAEQHDQRRHVAGHRDEAQRQGQRLEVVRPAHERSDGRIDRARTG